MVIKGAKYARLVVFHVRLQSLKGVFSYKERPLHRTVMPPKPNGTSSWIKNSALIREIEHGYAFPKARRQFAMRLQQGFTIGGMGPNRHFAQQ